LSRIATTVGTRLLYDYDFGDSWHIEIVVESITPASVGAGGVICPGGEQAGPPEDVGGIGGYAEFVKAIRNPRHRSIGRGSIGLAGASIHKGSIRRP
jgi:hypothetical protein